MNGFGFMVMTFIVISTLIGVLTTCSVPKKQDDSNKPVIIDTNSIGCNKYSYKGDRYWKCPKQLDIDYIEEHRSNGKTTSTYQVPVSNME